jgi:hypothetical protein
VVIAAPFILILLALLTLLALYAIIELYVKPAARRTHRAHYSRSLPTVIWTLSKALRR